MYMRIVRAQPPQGQAEEVARRWAAFMPERLRAQPGFQHAHFGIDRETGETAAVTVFDERPDDAMLQRLMSEFRDSLGQAGPAQAPEVTLYEIVTEV
jgi:Antibiotic biosynthesis monooxygenase